MVFIDLLVMDEFKMVVEKVYILILGILLMFLWILGNMIFYLVGWLVLCEFLYGVLVDISGVGVLIIGDFGVGKFEMVLELVCWGYWLVVDDWVEVYVCDE